MTFLAKTQVPLFLCMVQRIRLAKNSRTPDAGRTEANLWSSLQNCQIAEDIWFLIAATNCGSPCACVTQRGDNQASPASQGFWRRNPICGAFEIRLGEDRKSVWNGPAAVGQHANASPRVMINKRRQDTLLWASLLSQGVLQAIDTSCKMFHDLEQHDISAKLLLGGHEMLDHEPCKF